MVVNVFIENNKENALVQEIMQDYGGQKGAYKGAIDVVKQSIITDRKNGGTGERYKAYFNLLSTANAIRELSGIDKDYMEKKVDTTGYFDSFLRTLGG